MSDKSSHSERLPKEQLLPRAPGKGPRKEPESGLFLVGSRANFAPSPDSVLSAAPVQAGGWNGAGSEGVETYTFPIPSSHVGFMPPLQCSQQPWSKPWPHKFYTEDKGAPGTATVRQQRARLPTHIPVMPKPNLSPVHLQGGMGRAGQEVGTAHAKALRWESQVCGELVSEKSGLSGSQPYQVTAGLWNRHEEI